jgi:hypothetical protein
MPKFSQERDVEVDSLITMPEVVVMVQCLLRYSATLRDSIGLGLDSSHFYGANEMPFSFVYSVAAQLYKQHGALTAQMIITELQALRASNAMFISPEAFEYLTGPTGFVQTAFQPAPEDRIAARAERQHAEGILRRFIRARVISPAVQSVVNIGDGVVDKDLETKLHELTKKTQAVSYVGQDLENAARMPNIGEPIRVPPPRVPTTIRWIDEYIGGFRAGEVVGVLGASGGGKTTTLSTIAVRMAQQFSLMSPDKIAVYVGYEDPAEIMTPLFHSAAAQIPRAMFQEGFDLWSNLSDSNNLKAYDRELPMNRNGEIILGERERWLAAQQWLNDHFWYLDFSVNSETGGRGNGGVPEIAAALEQLSESTGKKIGCVCVDYTGLVVEREIMSGRYGRANIDNPHRQIKNVPDQLRTMVAGPMQCTVVLAHQLAGNEVQNLPPHRYVDHLSAAGSKAFAENLHACLCINKYDPKTFVSTINWSKIRASRPERSTGLVKMNDTYVDIALVNDEYTLSESGRCILRRGDVAPVTPDEVDTSRPRQASRRIMPVDTFANDMMTD